MNTEVCLIRADMQPAGEPDKQPRQGCPPRAPRLAPTPPSLPLWGPAPTILAVGTQPLPWAQGEQRCLALVSLGTPHLCACAKPLSGHQARAEEMFLYRQHQVFVVITTAIIISFGVFSCHNLSLALIYSAGLFPRRAGGKKSSIRSQRAPSPGKASSHPELSRGAPRLDRPFGAEQGCPHTARGRGRTRTCHVPASLQSSFPQTWCVLIISAAVGTSTQGAELTLHTQVGWEAEEAVHPSGMDSHPGATACGGIIAPTWFWRGCTSKALLPPPAPLPTSASLPGGSRAGWLQGKRGCAMGLQAGASLGKGPAVTGDAVAAICSHRLAPLPSRP